MFLSRSAMIGLKVTPKPNDAAKAIIIKVIFSLSVFFTKATFVC